MCGRFSLTVSADVLAAHFHLKNGIVMKPRYNIAPSQVVPVLKVPGTIEFLQWGFVPAWRQGKQEQGFINARVETISQKPSFRHAFQKRRCLVVADGYYEWKTISKIKQPYYIRREDRSIFAFAGIWENETCAILTTVADIHLLAFHERMPLILPPSTYSTWLNPGSSLKDQIEPLMYDRENGIEENNFEIYAVSTVVNNPAFEGPQCIQAL